MHQALRDAAAAPPVPQSTDRRSVRTRRALRQALADEIDATGDLTRVTVTAVTERAASDAAAAKAELDELKSSIESYRAACRKLIEDQLQTLKANDLLFK